VAFKEDLLAKLRALPGVDGAGEVDLLPLGGASTSNNVWTEGSDGQKKFDTNFNWVSGGYLKTMGIPLLAGRDFDSHDTNTSPLAAIVNQSFARKMGLRENPIDQRIRRESTPTEPEIVMQIVGLVPDTKYHELREEFQPIIYLATSQQTRPRSATQIVIHSAAPLNDTIARLRRAIVSVSGEMTMDFQSFASTVAEGLIRERLMATLSTFFGVLATLIAAIGLCGVMSYMVARRTHEIGIRMALGAASGQILSLILRQSSGLLAIGLGVGTVISLALAH
jgi:hypothetical protein